MKRWERLAALILAAVGVGAAIMAYRMGLGTLAFPGSGFFPFWVSVILAVISIFYLLTQLGPEVVTLPLWTRRAWLKPLLGGALMFLYVFLLAWIGFPLATFLLFVIWLGMEREKPLTIGLVATIGTLCVYLLFNRFLQIPLPVGRLFR